MEVEEDGRCGGGEAVGEQGEADHGHVLEGQVGAGEQVGQEVELVRFKAEQVGLEDFVKKVT